MMRHVVLKKSEGPKLRAHLLKIDLLECYFSHLLTLAAFMVGPHRDTSTVIQRNYDETCCSHEI